MSTQSRPVLRGHRRVTRSRTHRLLPVALGLTLLGVGGVVGPSVVENVAGGGAEQRRLTLSALPADAPDQGLVYHGLKPAKAGTLCAGAYALDDTTCTHGPATAPAGFKVRRDVAPVTAKSPEPVAPSRDTAAVPPDAEIARDQGGSALTADAPALIPDAAPGQADFIMGAHDVACEGDGRSGKRVQVVYLHEFGTPSRYTDFLGSVRVWSAGADQIFDASAAETGGSRHLRFVTTPQCRVDVAEVQLPTRSLTSFTDTIAALQTLGYNRTDRKYLMFADSNVYCGIATYVADRRAGLGNRNNGGPSYGRVDAGCWSSVMAARELTESLGAALIDSPNSSGAGGCLDDYDLLCGPDRSGKAVREVCPKKHENRLDCNHDDYFDTSPEPGGYLAKNWNIAQSEFLLRSDGGDDIPDAGVAGPPAATTPPTGAATPKPTVTTAAPTPTTTVGPGDGGDASDGGGDAPPPSAEVTPTAGGEVTGQPAEPSTTPEQPGAIVTEPAGAAAVAAVAVRPVATTATEPVRTGSAPEAEPVQAVLEVRDATSSSVRLTWSAAAPTATYEVWVDGAPIATTQATRARLIGLRPDAKFQVTIRSGATYVAQATAETAPAGRPAQNSWFVLTNALTGGAADLYAARTADGTPLTLSTGADADAQQKWQLVPGGNGSYSLVSKATGKCVVPLGGNPVAGAPLVQGECGGANNGRWSLQASDYGFTLRTTVGDLVVGVGNQRFGAQRVLTLQRGDGQRHQSWTAVPD
ncbi:RICIN domain-containing protein [Micromonosporaceae bacterium Da 78-11]